MTTGRDHAASIIWTLALIVLTLWALGWLGAVGGPTAHLLLVLAAALAGVAWRTGRG
ncbi:MAG: hypothetical protein IT340_11460 [Chloroflexi bacterium]|nr:hypothetical protein [Chloroflexota bacterium]